MAEVPVVLTIAGFDPSSGAGVTADLKTIAAHGLYGAACITSLTVQSTQGVRRCEAVSAKLVSDTLACLAEDLDFAAIKIGMLGTGEIVESVSEFLAGLGARRPAVVLDPVLCSSSGRALLDAAGVVLLREKLLEAVDWVTPNVTELAVLLGEAGLQREQVEEATERLRLRHGGARLNIVVTGGHLSEPDDFLVTADGHRTWLRGEWVSTTSTHGTGCAFSTALACGLALGALPETATRAAKDYVAGALRSAYPVGRANPVGRGNPDARGGQERHGPMHHLWKLKQGGS